MQIDDAAAFLVDYLRRPRPTQYPVYGYDIYLPNVIVAFIQEIEGSATPEPLLRSGSRPREVSPFFYEAAWDFCRRGILRPGVSRLGGQADGGGGDGYSLTEFGRQWIAGGASALLIVDPGRMGQMFGKLAPQLGAGFLQRASEAAQCYKFGVYLACCGMCGAAAESILLAAAAAKSGDEAGALARYRRARGRHDTIEDIANSTRSPIGAQFRSAMQLLSYWRDDAAHGTASAISEVEAHEAVVRLLRLAQLVTDHWSELIGRPS
jgi:hypothetical protein